MDTRVQNFQPLKQDQASNFDSNRILAIVFRRRWLIFAVAVPIIILAFIGTLRSTDFTTASTRVLIESNQASNLMYSTGRDDITEILATAAQIGMSIPVANHAALAIADSIPFLALQDENFAGEISQDDLRDVLLGGVDCSPIGESRIMRIAFSDPNPRFSLMAVEALTNAFINYSAESVRNAKASEFYDGQIEEVHEEIDALLKERAEILNSSNYSIFKVSARSESDFSGILDMEYQRTITRRLALEAKLKGVTLAIGDDPDFVPIAEGGKSPLLLDRKAAVEKAKTELALLNARYQSDYALVQRQIMVLEAARISLRDEQQNFLRDLRILINEQKQVENSYKDAIKARDNELKLFPDIERQVASIDLKIDTKRGLLKSLQVRRGEARLRADSDKRISNIIPLNKPTIDMTVAGGKKILYLTLASIFGLALGFMLALFVETQDHRLYDKGQLEQYLEIPVIGSISSSLEFKD